MPLALNGYWADSLGICSQAQDSSHTVFNCGAGVSNAPISAKPHSPPAIVGIRASFNLWVLPQGWGFCIFDNKVLHILPSLIILFSARILTYIVKELHIVTTVTIPVIALPPGYTMGNGRAFVGDYPKILATGGASLQPLSDKSPVVGWRKWDFALIGA